MLGSAVVELLLKINISRQLMAGPSLTPGLPLSEVMREETWAAGSSVLIKLRKDMEMYTFDTIFKTVWSPDALIIAFMS